MGDPTTAFTAQDVAIRPAAAGSGQLPPPALHAWRFTSQGEMRDALTLAGEVIGEWDALLHDLGLLPQVVGPAPRAGQSPPTDR
jgi:hypothetical protein